MKKRIFKDWITRTLAFVLGSYVAFAATTIDSLGNKVYDRIFVIYSILAIVSFRLLQKHSHLFD